jgi:hypothetical protein
MLTAKAGYGLEATIRSRQPDVERVVGLRDNLKAWGRHGRHYGTVWPVRVRNSRSVR